MVRALRAGLARDATLVEQLCTDDVKVWAPGLHASSVEDLVAALERRDDAFSDLELEIRPLEVVGEYACAEWSVSMTHSADLVFAEGAVLEATGLRITLHGVTVAEFRGSRIGSLRQYWDELSVFEQLGLLSDDAGG